MNKPYTAQEMRDFADAIARDLNESGHTSVRYTFDDLIPVIESLRQAADALEREERIRSEIKKISTMAVAPLDGHPMHQHTNTEKVAAVLEFFPKVKEILGGAKSLEREKKYEFCVKYLIKRTGSCIGRHAVCYDSFDEANMSAIHAKGEVAVIIRREVGEWEEVKDGE